MTDKLPGSDSIFLDTPVPDLTEETYRRLLEMIQLGRIPTNVPLQERTLASAMGVSRTPLREAFSRLVGGGFACRVGRGQLMIKEPTLREYLEILQLRILLEGEAAYVAAGRMPPEQADAVIAALQAHRLAQDFSAVENHRIDNLVHLTIAAHCGNAMLESMIFDLRIKARSFDQNGTVARFEPGCQEHIALMERIRVGDASGARQSMEHHITQARASIVARFTAI
ncbi:GntR family transcriptional regulator [Biostraticola tofi]|uniref:DNA-binding GntR family transcriptional regulator n=1 Tax=Biostraticola tofi TaxID=466109 RepID=A0A4V2W5A1_9GAMM|nr:GntR family transcriptional regulator [Biostraticola tofi]TCV98734.1 DNA-binding GntR family transcriptional regulator [Biostraticola tofi]